MDLQLSGKTVLITGGSRGIGLAVATGFAAEGSRVAITARNEDSLRSAAAAIKEATGNEVVVFPGDWTKGEDAERVVAATIAELGHLDIFVPNAGAAAPGDFESMTDERWLQSLNLKFMGHMRGCRAVLPHMVDRGNGVVTMVVGNDGLKPPFAEIVPGACNAADINVASSLAEKYGYLGIRVNTINPGPVDTTRWDWVEETISEERGLSMEHVRQLTLASLPLGYVCTPEEVANVVVFVSSPAASYVNGAHIPVDGAQRKALMYADQHFSIAWNGAPHTAKAAGSTEA
jgi:NAD(P)-dependent dehydrogenase (short-subunit alcohol dehydrogenase family)